MSLYEKTYGRPEEDVMRALVRVMRKNGVHKLDAEYSGGHDEGGVQSIVVMNSKGEPMELENLTWDHELWQACDEVMATKYYTWALEGYVCGWLHADLDDGRVWTDGQEEQTSYVPMRDPIDWRVR